MADSKLCYQGSVRISPLRQTEDRFAIRNDKGVTTRTIALAHGAGAGMDGGFMAYFAEVLARHGLRVVRFEFPYMAQRRKTDRKRPPDRESVLRETWLNVIEGLDRELLIIGGKSMGGRIASLLADEAGVAGLVCLGYPFHPTGKPERLRIEHLKTIETPTLILQGERDPFGARDEVGSYDLASTIRIHWLLDGDHSLKPRKASGRREQQNWDEAIVRITEFVQGLKV